MHIEILVEDSSGAKLLECLLPQILGRTGESHTWRVHPYVPARIVWTRFCNSGGLSYGISLAGFEG